MECPNCQNSLGYFKVQKEHFFCEKCKAELKIKNHSSAMNTSYLIWGLIISVGVGAMDSSFLGFILGALVGGIIHYFVTPTFFNIVEITHDK